MRTWLGWAGGLLVAGTAFATDGPATPACTSGRIHGVRSDLFVLATARADTVRAGPAAFLRAPVHGDSAALAGIHGQRFRLDRVGGDVPAELAGAAGGEAVLVPYGSMCRDVWRWDRARWAEPGAQLFADAVLRPRDRWVEGRPTFDVDVVHGWYPDSYTENVTPAPRDPLTPAQVFELNARLPTWEQMEKATFSAYRPLLAWARANPRLAGRFPATLAMEQAHYWLQPCVPPDAHHPVAGTYRATVVVNGRDTLTSWFRTSRSGYPKCAPAKPRLDLTAVQPRAADTVRLSVYGSRMDEAAIPATYPEARERPGSCSSVALDVLTRPQADAAGRRRWAADYDPGGFTACFRGDARVQGLGDALQAAYTARTLEAPPGWFQETADGGMRFERTWRVAGRPVLEVRATRTGPATLH
jgi:hypothetical protein